MLKKTLLALTLAAGIAFAGNAAAETKVGFVYVGPIGDHGWSYQHDQGRLAVEKELGVKTSYVESVPEGAEAASLECQLARSRSMNRFRSWYSRVSPSIWEFIRLCWSHWKGALAHIHLAVAKGRCASMEANML